MAKALTVKTIENIKPGAVRQEVSDGEVRGLYLTVFPSGKASWILRYRFGDRTRKFTIGGAPEIGLKDARDIARKAHVQIANGQDPGDLKRAAKIAERVPVDHDLVEKVAAQFLSRHVKGLAPTTVREVTRMLAKDIIPVVERLAEDVSTLVGIDHGFSFPLRYFEFHHLPPDWQEFLDDFQRHWPTDEDIYVDVVRDGPRGDGAARMGNSHWRRLTEERAGSAKSVFNFDVQGSVAKSTHAGIPWLRYIRERGKHVHFWPFDGWDIPAGRSAIVEVYPTLWSRSFANEGRTSDQHDAFSIAAWLSSADRNGSLGRS